MSSALANCSEKSPSYVNRYRASSVNQKSWNQPCRAAYHLPPQFAPVGQPVAVSGGIRLGGKRYWSPLQLLPAPNWVELYQYGHRLHSIASVPTVSGAVPGPTGAAW